MLNKLFKSLALSAFALFLFSGTSFAAYTTSIRLQQPGSPTNQDTFNIVFVALDTNPNQTVTVQCYKSGPGDGGNFVAFGSLITLSNGGNTASCQTNSGILNQIGTYSFEAIAQGSTNPTSNVVSVNFNNETPGTPTNYSKSQSNSCTYKISFHTANDNNETVKVVLYRSTDTSFSVDSGHQVNSINIGSNLDGSMTDNVSPNCNTTYYYVIRAFDQYGNGSGVVGDSNVNVTNVTTNPTTTTQEGAIPVGGTGSQGVLGAGTEKAVLGAESAKTTPSKTPASVSQNPVANSVNWILGHKKLSLGILIIVILLLALGYYAYHKNKKVK